MPRSWRGSWRVGVSFPVACGGSGAFAAGLGRGRWKNGAGDRDRTDDIQLGKRLGPGTLECRERSRIGLLGPTPVTVADTSEPSKSVRNLSINVLQVLLVM